MLVINQFDGSDEMGGRRRRHLSSKGHRNGQSASDHYTSRSSQESNERSNFKLHTTFLLFKCLGDLATRAFREKNPCENVTVPCWIPQADNIVDGSIPNVLAMCDTLEKYTCMLKKLKDAKYASPLQCHKSCIAEDYKTLSRIADIEPFTRVRCKERLVQAGVSIQR